MKNVFNLITLIALSSLSLVANSSSDEISFGSIIDEDKWEYYSIPNVKIDFQKTPLQDVVNVLAMAAGINYQMEAMELPEVSTQLRMNPFKALELMAKQNKLQLIKDQDIWFIGKKDSGKLVQKTYKLKNIHLQALNPVYRANHNNDHGHFVEYPIGGSEHASSLLHDVSAGTSVTEGSVVVDEIRKILRVSPSVSADNAFVSYEADTNSLYVIASQEQQKWIDSYLTTIDQDIPNIEMKIMFLSSSENPDRQFGVDWSGTLGDGYNVNVSGLDDKGNKTPIQFGGLGSLIVPSSAILSTDVFNVKLRALESNSENETKRYPIMTGYSNREVLLNFTKNEPVVTTTTDTQVQTSTNNIGSGTTNTIQVTQEQVGTVVRLLPRFIEGNRISMDIDIGVSNILGFKTLQGNDYPIISQTRYQGQSVIESGYTVVIGGLEEIISDNSDRGIKLLKDIPFFGWFFKDKKRSEQKQKLSLYISVRLLDSKGEPMDSCWSDSESVARKAIEGSLMCLNREISRIEADLMR